VKRSRRQSRARAAAATVQFLRPQRPDLHPPALPARPRVNKCNIDYVVIGDASLVTDSNVEALASSASVSLLGELHLEDVLMMGADYYQTEKSAADKAPEPPSIASPHLSHHYAIIDKNARIGDGVSFSRPANPTWITSTGSSPRLIRAWSRAR